MKSSPNSPDEPPGGSAVTAAIAAALDRPVDYSAAFTASVRALGADLATSLALPLRHDADMNYASGQRLWLALDERGEPTDANTATYRLITHVSSRGPLYTFSVLRRDPAARRHDWCPTELADAPPALRQVADRVGAGMDARGYVLVPRDLLTVPAEGHTTDMDGAPATTFQALFAELVA
jgi:hypothetical protein